MNPKDKHQTLVKYLKVKTTEGDWHGVSDAANDLRVLEAQQPTSSHTYECSCADCDKVRTAE